MPNVESATNRNTASNLLEEDMDMDDLYWYLKEECTFNRVIDELLQQNDSDFLKNIKDLAGMFLRIYYVHSVTKSQSSAFFACAMALVVNGGFSVELGNFVNLKTMCMCMVWLVSFLSAHKVFDLFSFDEIVVRRMRLIIRIIENRLKKLEYL